MKNKVWSVRFLAILTLAGLAAIPARIARAEISITLQNEFIEQYKGRVTVDTNFVIDKAHKKPNPPSKDGDLHIAGRAEEVKLPIVAEIMNARDDLDAVEKIHEAEGTGDSIPMSGAWRLWCEHGGNSEQIQGEELEPFTTTNPDHVFEIHPVSSMDSRSLLPTLKPIEGFKTKDAHSGHKHGGLQLRRIHHGDQFQITGSARWSHGDVQSPRFGRRTFGS